MITWDQIEAECGDFRQGFVSAFRKYEGQETDERDKYRKVVKVTMASFARHMGIDEDTFARWCGNRKENTRNVRVISEPVVKPQETPPEPPQTVEEPETPEPMDYSFLEEDGPFVKACKASSNKYYAAGLLMKEAAELCSSAKESDFIGTMIDVLIVQLQDVKKSLKT